MNKNYIFCGDFLPLVKGRPANGRSFDEYMANRIKFCNIIETQHGDDKRFRGNLHLVVSFMVPLPEGMGRKNKEKNDMIFFSTRPAIGYFIRVLEELIGDILMDESGAIVSVQADKRRSIEPRVEFILSEIE